MKKDQLGRLIILILGLLAIYFIPLWTAEWWLSHHLKTQMSLGGVWLISLISIVVGVAVIILVLGLTISTIIEPAYNWVKKGEWHS